MKLNKKQIFDRLGEVDDAYVEESALPEETVILPTKRRRIVAAFFEKPVVVAAICGIVALGTMAGIIIAGHAPDGKLPQDIGGTQNRETDPIHHLEHETDAFTTPDHETEPLQVLDRETEPLPERESTPIEAETTPDWMGNIVRHEDLYYLSHGNGTCSLVGIAALPEDMVLTIPETAMNGDRVIALWDMTMTSSLAVPNGVHLFQVKGIHIPATMMDVHINTLHEMTALESLTVDEGNPVYRSEQSCLIEREGERLVYAYLEFVAPPSGPIWQDYQPIPFFNFIVPDSVKVIATNALRCDIDDASVEINDVIYGTEVDISDVRPMTFPVQLHIPASVEHIEERFFANHDYETVGLSADENNFFYYVEGNCLIRKADNTVILGNKNAKIPDNIIAIAPYAFYGAGLTSIHIPSTVQHFGEQAFGNNPQLESITGDLFKPTIQPDEDGTYHYYLVRDNCLIYFEDNINMSSLSAFKFEVVLGCKNSVIPECTTRIGDFAFAWNQGLTEINLPAGLQSIGFKAFAHCPNLMILRYGSTYERWCQVAVDETWIYDNGQLTELHFSDSDIPMIVVGVEFDYSGKGKTEN